MFFYLFCGFECADLNRFHIGHRSIAFQIDVHSLDELSFAPRLVHYVVAPNDLIYVSKNDNEVFFRFAKISSVF